jgi:hypothetical protein
MVESELAEVVHRLAVIFGRLDIDHALIGGLAVSYRGQPRATKDADFILSVPALEFPSLLEELIAVGFEIDLMDAIKRWSVERFLALSSGGVRVDWMQPILPLYATVLRTAESESWLEADLRIATAEGLILTKIVAFRPRDQIDIETLLAANRDNIDLELIRREWATVAEGEDTRNAWLENAIERLVTPYH